MTTPLAGRCSAPTSSGATPTPVPPDLIRDVRKANHARAFPWRREERDEDRSVSGTGASHKHL